MQALRRILHASVVFAALTNLSPLSWAQQTHDVAIRDYKFEPTTLHIKVGDTVRWTNKEKRTSHSVLLLGAASLESDRLFPGESWQRVFDKPGTYPYSCGPHPEMRGTVVVTD